MKLEGKVALVTGAARGIGRATAEKLAAEGATVVASDIDAAPLEEAMSEVSRAVTIAGDLTAPEFPDRLVAEAIERFGSLDIVVNNAGYIWNGAAHNHTDEQWQAMLDIHATVPFRILRAWGRWLRRLTPEERITARKVVNVSSVSGLFGAPTQVAYSAGKAAVLGLTRTLAREWGRFNVNVNAVAFGHIETRLTQTYDETPPTIEVGGRSHKVGLSSAQREQQRQAVPLGRPGTVEEAAGAIYLFCIPESDYVTGEVLVCGGGLRA